MRIILAVLLCLAGCSKPPEPVAQAELIRPEQIEIPRLSYICSQTGEEAMVYSGSEGQIIITPTGQSCDYEAWRANGPTRAW